MRRRVSGAVLAVAVAAGALALPTAQAAAPAVVVSVASVAETAPVAHSGDSADDPAIWVDRADPSRSLVIGNDKGGALESYDLSGALVQRITDPGGKWGNVDVRQEAGIPGAPSDVVAAINNGIRFYSVDRATRRLSPVTDGTGVVATQGEGLCLYRGTSGLYAFVVLPAGTVRQYAVTDADHDGLLEGALVRTLDVGGKAEGCAADDATAALYVAQEDTALWRYGAEPAAGAARTQVDTVVATGGHLAPDIEGLTSTRRADGRGVLLASAQNDAARSASYFTVYDLDDGRYLGAFRVVSGTKADDCDGTDGVAAYAGSLGPAFPDGLFVCQDNSNGGPGTAGNQDFKYASMARVLAMLPTAPPPSGAVSFVARAGSDANSASPRVVVPGGVAAGDTLLLVASTASAVTVATPAGWQPVGQAAAGSLSTRVFQRRATAADAGATVTVALGRTSKTSLQLTAYRGVGGLSATFVTSTVGAAARTAPAVSVPTAGSWVVSYWADRSSTDRTWSAPTGLSVRGTTYGTGGGRVSSLLADSAGPVPAGPYAARTATTSASSAQGIGLTLLLARV